MPTTLGLARSRRDRSGIREWIPDDGAEPGTDLFDQRPKSANPPEIPREDGSVLVFDSD